MRSFRRERVAEPHRGVVEAVQAAGSSRGGLRRQLRDRPGYEGRHATAKPESEAVGVGTRTRTAEASEAYFCVPYLRNGALVRSSLSLPAVLIPRDI